MKILCIKKISANVKIGTIIIFQLTNYEKISFEMLKKKSRMYPIDKSNEGVGTID